MKYKTLVTPFRFITAFLSIAAMTAGEGWSDTVYFKDGTKTVCRERAWEENGKVHCEFYGTIVAYPLKQVERIETANTTRQSDTAVALKAPPAKVEENEKTATGNAPQPAISAPQPTISDADAPKFYDPRRPKKYWSSPTAHHHSLNEALSALAAEFDRPTDWIKARMGNSNNLSEIRANLARDLPSESSRNPLPPEPSIQPLEQPDGSRFKGILFYDPRRNPKYRTSLEEGHETMKQALAAFARKFGRSEEWIKHHMGNTNDLGDIYHNLMNAAAM